MLGLAITRFARDVSPAFAPYRSCTPFGYFVSQNSQNTSNGLTKVLPALFHATQAKQFACSAHTSATKSGYWCG